LEAENGTIATPPWVVILIRIMSEALIILVFISPVDITGFDSSGLRVDHPVLHEAIPILDPVDVDKAYH
jgi:hypothetical protein